ncbi:MULTISPECIES: TIGR03086 family metal-binding protein [unclassified Streptomyces]|uniref:TIGR03086 family metal-binding protein n=1 Tax=unclassified Streptomyces TaxID=2593676 RepID=UPI002E801CBB|nr:TIGR03086 family metal-binding protein [Streptomyces sp. NBC_00562]WUC23378.1 TIGR03086 family metal-binding protein [Streptomyces sp. NBC_00562]
MASRPSSARDLLDRHAEALQLFTDRVHAVRDDQWSASTPCTEWFVRDLVTHLTSEQLWVPPLLTEGRTVAQVGDAFDGDVLGDDPVTVWDRAAAEARKAFAAPGALKRTVNLSYGDSAADAYCAQMVSDAVVHSWDLSRAIGADERLPEDLVEFTRREVGPYVKGLSQTGLFARPVKTEKGADPQTELLALLGRQV